MMKSERSTGPTMPSGILLGVSFLGAFLGVLLLLWGLAPGVLAAPVDRPEPGILATSTVTGTGALRPYLVQDIYTGLDGYNYPNSGTPEDLVVLGDTVFFIANDGLHGKELWKTTGAANDAELVRDLVSGAGSAYPDHLTAFDGKLFFQADGNANGKELWVSDGTYTGTTMLRDIYFVGDGLPSQFTEYNGELFFVARDTRGFELWKTDGTYTNTVLVRDIYTGSNSSSPYGLVAGTDGVYFRADDGVSGAELWKSDGTTAGTVLVKDIHLTGASSPLGLTAFGGKIYFRATDGVYGDELWVSDGTPSGTQILKNINPAGGSYPDLITALGGSLYFFANDGANGKELWQSDGTTAGTELLKDINAAGSVQTSNLTTFVAAGDLVFFNIDDGTHGFELWRTDGTTNGTQLVKDLNPGDDCDWLGVPGEGSETCSSTPRGLIAVNRGIYFSASDREEKQELFLSDGTPTGTHRVTDVFDPEDYTRGVFDEKVLLGDLLLLVISDVDYGQELWALDIRPDLIITKTVQPAGALSPGDPITYTLTFQNQGGSSTRTIASGVMLADYVPPIVTNPVYTATGAALSEMAGFRYFWQVEELSPLEGGIVTITGIISPALTSPSTFSNTAEITSLFSADMITTNNTSEVWSTVSVLGYKVYIPLVLR